MIAERPVQNLIANRRTIRRFAPDRVPRETIERLLSAAVQAPNHRRTQPWRFFVLDRDGPAREAVANLAYEAALERAAVVDDAARGRAEAKRQEIRNTPVVMIVYATPGRDEETTHENYAAVCCGVQNLMLAALEEGLVSGWSTGGLAKHPRLRELVGAEPDWQLVSLLYLGWPEPNGTALPPRQNTHADFTRWLAD
ncbi:MAG TPA: nitroreductase [Chloroflexota bacterium]|jgi:nitroreductase|nr:nitroreductase [Chloroflexota bacterium]